MDYKHFLFLIDQIDAEIVRQHDRFVISFSDVDRRNLSEKELKARKIWSDIKYKEYQKEEYELRKLKNTLSDCVLEYTKKKQPKNKDLIAFWNRTNERINYESSNT